MLAFFSGEEQGLQGSRVYAKTLKDREKNVRFMLQADMLGYHLDGEPMQIAFPDRYDTIEAVSLSRNVFLDDLQLDNFVASGAPDVCQD